MWIFFWKAFSSRNRLLARRRRRSTLFFDSKSQIPLILALKIHFFEDFSRKSQIFSTYISLSSNLYVEKVHIYNMWKKNTDADPEHPDFDRKAFIEKFHRVLSEMCYKEPNMEDVVSWIIVSQFRNFSRGGVRSKSDCAIRNSPKYILFLLGCFRSSGLFLGLNECSRGSKILILETLWFGPTYR